MATANDRDMTAKICSALRSQLGVLFQCEAAGERVQISTPFLMPDGHQVDLYWRETRDGQVISDLGDTYGWLFVNGAYEELTPAQDAAYDAACSAYGVERLGVTLLARIGDGQLADAVIRLGQAITMVSHTLDVGQPSTKKVSETEKTAARIVSVIRPLRNIGWRYRRSYKMAGRDNRDWKMDFMVNTPERDAALMALHARKRPGRQRRAIEHVFTLFSDLEPTLMKSPNPIKAIAVIDDTEVSWHDEPIELLTRVSEVVWLSEPDSLVSAIAVRPDGDR